LQFLLTGQLTSMRDMGMDVVAIASPGPFLDELARQGVRTYGVTMPRRVSPLRDLGALGSLIRILRMERPDIVHTHTPKAGLVGICAAFLAGVPIRIHTYAGAPYDTTKGLAVTLAKRADQMTAYFATDVWSVGYDLTAFLEDEHVVERGRLEVIGAGSSNGVDLEHFFPVPHEQPGFPPRFAWIGRLSEDKGLEELVAMWTAITQWSPQATLEIIGDLDARNPVARATIESLQQDKRVHFAGWRLDIAECLRAADVLLFTSRREGLPGVVLQAQACGVPVVALCCRGITDALIDGVGGRIFARTEICEAARSASHISRNAALWRAYRIAGRKFVAERFDRQAFHREVAQRYHALLARVLPGG
jgi:glycosyltransferase involved in cell wall biosynthesis